MRIPQADDVAKIEDVPLAVKDGYNTAKAISSRYRFNRRQGDYYLQAAELLGFVQRRGNRYLLTSFGHQYLRLTPGERRQMFVRSMLLFPAITRVIAELFVSPNNRLTRRQVISLFSTHSGISGTTVDRRGQSIFSWLSWLAEETKVLKVPEDRSTVAISSSK